MDAAALLADAHGRALRPVAAHGVRHVRGLWEASHAMTALPTSVCCRLANLDVAYSLVPHITGHLVEVII